MSIQSCGKTKIYQYIFSVIVGMPLRRPLGEAT